MEMPIVRYGHWGPALLLFPTWQADFMEAEDRGLIGAIQHHIAAGRLSVFCINSISRHAWCNEHISMLEKSARQAAYSGYVEEEVVPLIRRVLQDDSARMAVGGASFGAFFAANALFRRPELFSTLIGMSGFYQLERVLHGYSDENVYFNSPEWFVPNLPEGPQLELLRHHTRIHLLSGRGEWEYPELTERFSAVLRARGIPHWLDLWGHDMPHEWVTWKRMLDVVISERLS
jgi:esterase/lipase superfamily enzyme